MQCTYRLRTDLIRSDEGRNLTVYGIDVVDLTEHMICSVPDVFFERKKAEDFVKLCNSSDLRSIHFMDVVNDVII